MKYMFMYLSVSNAFIIWSGLILKTVLAVTIDDFFIFLGRL